MGLMRNNRSIGDHATALSYQSSFLGLASFSKVLNDRNVINSDQTLLCLTTIISPPNDPSNSKLAND